MARLPTREAELPGWLTKGTVVTLPRLDTSPSAKGRRYKVVKLGKSMRFYTGHYAVLRALDRQGKRPVSKREVDIGHLEPHNSETRSLPRALA